MHFSDVPNLQGFSVTTAKIFYETFRLVQNARVKAGDVKTPLTTANTRTGK
jgi:hypothetical protein